jgi:subtilisin family serine protease
MASALNDELLRQHSKPVIAKQILWDLDHNPRESLLKALLISYKENPKVLSLSLGGRRYDTQEEAYVAANTLNDTVVVAAAGNDGGGKTYYPANYSNECILSVGTSYKGKKADFSNHGAVWLEYNPKDPRGTSASTARMAAIVLQIRRQNPELDCKDIVLTMKMLYGKIQK